MNIWIFVLGEPIESDSANIRLHRSGMLTKYLVAAGHKVTFWTSNVNHVEKKLRHKETHISKLNENYTEVILSGRIYKKNISIKRILHNIDVTREFRRISDNFEEPDIVVTNYPIIELSDAVINFCKKKNIPSIVDIRDFWPDIFYETLPKKIKFIGHIIFLPWKVKAKNIIKNVTAVSGISDEAIRWARKKNNQTTKHNDKSFPLAYENNSEFSFNQEFLDKNELDPSAHSIYCFFGSLSNRIELNTVINAAELFHKKNNKKIKLVICGSGEMTNILLDKSKTTPSLILPGWINKNEINTLLSVSKAGLLPYPSSLDFVRSYPNKVGEYLSKNLPILSSVQGEMEALLKDRNCGITYKNKSAQSLVEAIEFIEDNENQRVIMSENAKKCFQEKFDSNIVYKKYVKYIESISKIKI